MLVLRDVVDLGHWEADEADARVAVVIRLSAGDRAGKALFSVEAVPRGKNHVAFFVAVQAGPKGLLDGF